MAVLVGPEFYPHRKEDRAARTYGTTSTTHPGVAQIMAMVRRTGTALPSWS